MNYALQELAALPLGAKMLLAVSGVLLIRIAFRSLGRTLPPHFGHGDARYRARKHVELAGYIVVVAFIAILFEDRLSRVSFTLGLFGAGVVVALQDVIASIAGSFVIGFSSLYRVGDRIQIDETRGDVIDISLLRTVLMETGNWVSGDLYNGRVVRVPNHTVLRSVVFNYSQGFRFVWDEIKARLTYESDHIHARQMLQRVVEETVTDYLVEAQNSWKWVVENYRIEHPLLEPVVTLVVKDGALEFSVSYIVDYTKRTVVKDHLFTKIVDAVANSNGRLHWSSSSTTHKVEIVSSIPNPAIDRVVQQPN